ncbi:CBM9 family sugar-binding protein [Paraferrimonas sp. SM1919]|uniref:CBM9 family sugar-binding protein n=1 Tax=Paraferrimonas sp. SM1919 TaxID=2662263 RepID=UPI0013D510A8|nr:CBM9 family sugar-binding protein [Paraferrimonas sp. SM1919]
MLKRIAKLLSLFLAASSTISSATEQPLQLNPITKASAAIVIDGKIDKTWDKASWAPLDKAIIGQLPHPTDFSGRYKLLWDKQHLYVLAEIQDDVLFDARPDPTDKYWDDDCLEIFVDEDASGGEHQFNFNAFAYHLGLDNQVSDIGPMLGEKVNFITLNAHVRNRWQRQTEPPYKIIWEAAVKLYDDSFTLDSNHQPVTLYKGKTIGFMLAYCDNDGSAERESFIGSHEIAPVNGDKNLGYKDASVFARYTLVK